MGAVMAGVICVYPTIDGQGRPIIKISNGRGKDGGELHCHGGNPFFLVMKPTPTETTIHRGECDNSFKIARRTRPRKRTVGEGATSSQKVDQVEEIVVIPLELKTVVLSKDGSRPDDDAGYSMMVWSRTAGQNDDPWVSAVL